VPLSCLKQRSGHAQFRVYTRARGTGSVEGSDLRPRALVLKAECKDPLLYELSGCL